MAGLSEPNDAWGLNTKSDDEAPDPTRTQVRTPAATPLRPQTGKWQWVHKSGFQDYAQSTSHRIEEAYQRGESHVRVKTGKSKDVPMVLFFIDMIQFDPISGNVRVIRRVGTDPCTQWIVRKVRQWMLAVETGNVRRMKFSQYDKQRKELLKEIEHQEYDVVLLYHETGFCSNVARSGWFFLGIAGIVVLNALWLGVEVAWNTAGNLYEADAIFQIMENLFCTVFFVEVIVRFGAFKHKQDCRRDFWFVSDSSLVLLMALDTWVISPILYVQGGSGADISKLSILRLARLLRLTKIGRIARVLRAIPELMGMLKGITRALRSVFFVVVLLVIYIYLFAIIFFSLSEDNPVLKAQFPTLTDTWWVLLVQATFLDDIKGLIDTIRPQSELMAVSLVLFSIGSSFTLLNMLIAIICEVVVDVSGREKDQAAVSYLRNNLMDILEVHDKDGDRYIHKKEFELLMRNPEVHMILTNFGVDAEDLISLKDVLFEAKAIHPDVPGQLGALSTLTTSSTQEEVLAFSRRGSRMLTNVSFADFLERVMRLRGGNSASVRDIVELREYVRKRIDNLEDKAANAAPISCGDCTGFTTVKRIRDAVVADAGEVQCEVVTASEGEQPVPESASSRKPLEHAVAVAEGPPVDPPPWVAELRTEMRAVHDSIVKRERTEASFVARISALQEEVLTISSRLDYMEHPHVPRPPTGRLVGSEFGPM